MLDDIISERLKKKERLESLGFSSYPAESKRTHGVDDVLKNFEPFLREEKKVFIVGRIKAVRNQGGVIFSNLEDETGKLQIIIKKDLLSHFSLIEECLDIGDIIEIHGIPFVTKRGEKSIVAHEMRWLTKSLRPIPSEWYGIEDVELRLRKRYLDILVNKDIKELFIKKSNFWDAARKYMKKSGFLEVETSILESIPGGADAEPFVTHHNALDVDFYLRISLELPLKRLLVAGYEKVVEIGRVFRNEGIDHEHLQDYTQLEFYSAYEDYRGLMRFVEKMYKYIIKETLHTFTHSYRGNTISWDSRWPKIEYYQIFKDLVGLDLKKATREELLEEARRRKFDAASNLGRGRLIDLLYKKVVRHTLISPVFLVNPPSDIEPLAKRMKKSSDRVERFQVVAGGTELGKGFSENNDPIDQRERFKEQMSLRELGDPEAQRLDEDFLEALEYGMPPAAGYGFSERLFSVLMDKPVRESVIFPLMRPKNE